MDAGRKSVPERKEIPVRLSKSGWSYIVLTAECKG